MNHNCNHVLKAFPVDDFIRYEAMEGAVSYYVQKVHEAPGGAETVIISYHWTREEAIERAEVLAEKERAAYDYGYDDIISEAA